MSYFILQFPYLALLIPLKLSYSLYFMIFLHTGFLNVFFFLNLQYYFCLIVLLGTLIPYYYCYLITTIYISTLTLFSLHYSDILIYLSPKNISKLIYSVWKIEYFCLLSSCSAYVFKP